jgi:hypothetical protein
MQSPSTDKEMIHVEEADAHAVSELGHERDRSADLEEFLRNRVDYGLRSK